MRTLFLFEQLASSVQAYHNCVKDGNIDWQDKHEQTIKQLCREFMPSGSGFDHGTELVLEKSNGNKLVFSTSFHTMNENGFYAAWLNFSVTVTPSFIGNFDIRISGRNYGDIKEYFQECFSLALQTEIIYNEQRQKYILADKAYRMPRYETMDKSLL